ncbi:fungal-specific transcription factor domain-containing protein [Powellomyces hirtus]|nr:fungal-specific transcription factor domain-containing protein [Powellomyces hirtus]
MSTSVSSSHASPPPNGDSTTQEKVVKTRKPRVQACDRCRTRKRKCNGAHPTCSNCETARSRGQLDVACTYAEKKKRPRRQRRDILLGRLEALEALLRPLQADAAAADGPAATTVAATRAEIAGILQGLAGSRSTEKMDDGSESGDNSEEEDDSPGNDDNMESSLPSNRGSFHQSNGTPENSYIYSSPPQSNPYASDDEDLLDGSPAMTISDMSSNHDVPLFDAISWPALVSGTVSPGPATLTYTINPNILSSPPSHPGVPSHPALNSSPNQPPAQASFEPPHLFTHLISLYFQCINPCMPVFDEDDFFSNLIPNNNHPPAVLYAMYMYGAPHSRHPALFQEPYRNPLAASELFHAEATRSLDTIENVVTRMQVLVMLGKWSFGMNQPARAYQYLSSAIQASERARLGYVGGHEKQRLLALWGPAPVDNPLHTLRSMRLTWSLCFTSDTYISMTTDVSPTIEESNYVHLLAEAVENSRALQLNPDAAQVPPQGDGSWRRILEGHPSFSVHDFRPPAWAPPIGALELTCSRTKPWFTQLQFILRRITRFARSVPFNSHRYDGTSAGIVFSVLPNSGGATSQDREVERMRLHNVLIDWWGTIPHEERAFTDLDAFRTGKQLPPLPSVSQLGSFQFAMMNSFFVAAFSMLHHREGPDLDVAVSPLEYPTSNATSPPTPPATSREILMYALRAQIFLIRSIYAMHGFDAIPPAPSTNSSPTAYVPFSAAYPPPPNLLVQNPMTLYACWCVCEAALVDLSRISHTDPQKQLMQDELFAAVSTVFLPMLDSSVRIWTVMRIYAARLRDAAHKIVMGEQVWPMRGHMGSTLADVADMANNLGSSLRV